MPADVWGIEYAWVAWAISWMVAGALWSDRAAKRPNWLRSALPYGLEVSGFVLLLGVFVGPHGPFSEIWPLPAAAGWALVGVAALGFAFAWWARITMGRLWSGTITRKADHRLIDTGPFAIVRHPIYTGLLLAVVASVAVKGTALALAGAVLLAGGWYVKARTEEAFLREELGAADYDAYRARVPMLIPFARI